MKHVQVAVTHSNNHVMGINLPNESDFDENRLHTILNKVGTLNVCINELRSLVAV